MHPLVTVYPTWNIQRPTLHWSTTGIFTYLCHYYKDQTKKSQGIVFQRQDQEVTGKLLPSFTPCELTLTRSVSGWTLHLKDCSDQIKCIMSSQGCLSFRPKNVFIVDIIEYWALSLLPYCWQNQIMDSNCEHLQRNDQRHCYTWGNLWTRKKVMPCEVPK